MSATDSDIPRRFVLSATVLVAALLLVAVHPLTNLRLHHRVHSRPATLSQPRPLRQHAGGGSGSWYPRALVGVAPFSTVRHEALTAAIHVILRTHRSAYVPIAVGHLKLPSSQSDPL